MVCQIIFGDLHEHAACSREVRLCLGRCVITVVSEALLADISHRCLLLATPSLFLRVLLGWVPSRSWQLTEFLSHRKLDCIRLLNLLPIRLESEKVVVMVAQQLLNLSFHLFYSLFEHLLPVLTFLDFF